MSKRPTCQILLQGELEHADEILSCVLIPAQAWHLELYSPYRKNVRYLEHTARLTLRSL